MGKTSRGTERRAGWRKKGKGIGPGSESGMKIQTLQCGAKRVFCNGEERGGAKKTTPLALGKRVLERLQTVKEGEFGAGRSCA